MVVQHNLTAMNSNRMLGLTTASQAKSTEKLSSGYKINRAADDAAGLSISEKMRKQIRGLTQASLNAQDGISAVQTAEGALTEVHDMLQRMNELAVKASNGTNSEDDRSYIQNEIDQLVTEIDRVSTTTKFNETYLLQGNARGKFFKQHLLSDQFLDLIEKNKRPMDELMSYYQCAIMEVETKFKVLNQEYSLEYDRNPIEGIKTRVKSYDSILRKIRRKNIPMTLEGIEENIRDIAGVRVICSFPDDIYELAESFLRQDDITLIERKDYIKNPKESGYRSLHLIVQVPIFLQNTKKLVYVEVQFRTIAMDFWASLEHKLQYKKNIPESQAKFLKDELYDCAQQSAALDKRMQNIRNVIAESETKEEEKQDFLPIFLRENKG